MSRWRYTCAHILAGITIACALSYLTFDLFDGSILFSIIVFAIGVGIVLAASLTGTNKAIETERT